MLFYFLKTVLFRIFWWQLNYPKFGKEHILWSKKGSNILLFKVAVSTRLFWYFFFHETNPPLPLINSLKWFWWKIPFCRDMYDISDFVQANTAGSQTLSGLGIHSFQKNATILRFFALFSKERNVLAFFCVLFTVRELFQTKILVTEFYSISYRIWQDLCCQVHLHLLLRKLDMLLINLIG